MLSGGNKWMREGSFKKPFLVCLLLTREDSPSVEVTAGGRLLQAIMPLIFAPCIGSVLENRGGDNNSEVYLDNIASAVFGIIISRRFVFCHAPPVHWSRDANCRGRNARQLHLCISWIFCSLLWANAKHGNESPLVIRCLNHTFYVGKHQRSGIFNLWMNDRKCDVFV